MNELMIQNLAYAVSNMKETMSSREIAMLTGKRHDHVMRDIENMIENMESKGVPKAGGTLLGSYINEQNGQKYPQWQLAKEDSLTLASGYEPALRKIIILRWAERGHSSTGPMQLCTASHRRPRGLLRRKGKRFVR